MHEMDNVKEGDDNDDDEDEEEEIKGEPDDAWFQRQIRKLPTMFSLPNLSELTHSR
jgi:hypothetical protein